VTTRSAVLGRLIVTSTAAFTIFTVPAGETWIVKSIALVNNAAGVAAGNITLRDASATFTVPLVQFNLASTVSGLYDVWAILSPGDVLRIGSSAFPMIIWVSGTKLTGVAP
jgi:hypothetical protein